MRINNKLIAQTMNALSNEQKAALSVTSELNGDVSTMKQVEATVQPNDIIRHMNLSFILHVDARNWALQYFKFLLCYVCERSPENQDLLVNQIKQLDNLEARGLDRETILKMAGIKQLIFSETTH